VRLSSEDLIALREARLGEARDQVATLPALIEDLRTLMRAVYPPHVIAVVAGWGLRTGVGPGGVSPRGMIEGVEQHHVELLQAISLTIPAAEWGREPAEPQDMQKAIKSIVAIADAEHGRRLLAVEAPFEPAEAAVLGLQERIRTHTQAVRNWGYSSEVLRITRALYGPLDAALRGRLGFTATEMIAVITAVADLVDQQVGDRFRLLKSIWRARSLRQFVRLFFQRYPGVEGDPEAFLRGLDPREPEESVRFRLLSHADRRLVACAVVSAASVAERAKVEPAVASVVMDRLSYPPGALVGQKVDRLFMNNPVWFRPGIRTGAAYFFSFPQTASSFIHPILRAVFAEAGLAEKLADRRSAYLEEELERLLKLALPGATVKSCAKWRWDGKSYETDVLAVLDRTVVIAEAKSHTLSAEGLRGAPDRVRKHIQSLVVDPAEQSERLDQLIRAAGAGDAPADAVVSGLGIDPTKVDTVLRLSVTLDDFSALSSAEGELKRAGWVREDLDLPATLNVADLACVVDLLGPAHVLHYFSERRRIQKRVNLIGDELDLIGFYLQTGFVLNGMPEVASLAITEMSADIDRYYSSKDAGVLMRKPAPRRGLVVGPILDRLLERRPEGWTTAAIGLLNGASHDEQKAIRRQLDALRGTVAKRWREPDHTRAFLWVPPDADDPPWVFHIFPRALASGRYEAAEGLGGEALTTTGRCHCILVGRMVEEWDKPFAYVGVAYADD